jgi:tetratricopeptide (TPR) repeat protein
VSQRNPRLLLFTFIAGCASTPHVAPVAVPELRHGQAADAALDELSASFYGPGLPPDEAQAKAEAILQRRPGDSRAHEIAAFAALLRGETEASFAHFLGAAADLDADVPELYLWNLSREPRAHVDAIATLCDRLRAVHPRAAVRALATAQLAAIRLGEGKLDEAQRLAGTLGLLHDWQLLGAFDNDQGKGFLGDLPKEAAPAAAIAAGREIPGPLVPVRWRPVALAPLGDVPLDDLLWPREFAAAYLVTWIHSDAARSAQLRISTSSPTRASVNDAEVLSVEQVAGADFDNLVAPIALRAGWNQLIIKSAHRRGGWRVRARITDEAGAPLGGLRTTATPQAYERGTVPDETVATLALAGPNGRQQLLGAQRLIREGRVHEALPVLRPLVDDQPHNLLGLYFGALAYWDNEELGRTIDLLDQGVTLAGHRAAAFLVKRARYYAQKQMWEKAQADLAEAAANDAHRTALVDLAELFERRSWSTDRCRLLERMLARRPDDGYARREHAECLDALGYLDAADDEYARALHRVPGDLDSWSRRIHLAARRGRLREAVGWIHQVERLDPTEPAWPLLEGDLQRRAGTVGAALSRYQQAIQMAPERPAGYARLGDLHYERGDQVAARLAWARAHERDPNDSALAQHIEYLEPVKLGFIEKLVPDAGEIDRALRQNVQPSPHAQQILLLDHEVTEVNADGSARRVVTEVARAVDDKGRDAMTHERLPPGPLKILSAYALSPKGERQEASSIRGGEIRFRNLQVGSRTVLQYIHYAAAPHFLPGAYIASWYFQSPARQQERSTWVLVLQQGRTLHTQITGPVEHEVRDEDGRQVHVFRSTSMAPIAQEPHMAPPLDLAAHVEVSTVESWEDYVRWERALLVDAFRANPTLDALTDRLITGAKTPREKLDRLFHHAAQEIRYQQDYENTIAGVRPHGAPSVIERGYGDCKDKAVLLIQMARRVGLKLSFAILRTTPHGQVARDVPNQQFNHAIVYVPAQPGIEQPLFMDPTSDGLDLGNLRVDDQGALSLVLDPTSGKWEFLTIPYQGAELQYDHHKVHIEVKSPTEAIASDELSLRGVSAMGLRHVLRNQGQAKQVLDALAAIFFSGATVKSTKGGSKEDILHPLSVSIEVDDSQSLRAEDDHFRLAMPGRFELDGTVALKARETPMRLGPPSSAAYDIDAQLPDGFQVTHAPKDFVVEQACFTLSRKAKVEQRHVAVHLAYQRRCTDVTPADYGAYRDAVQRAKHALDDELLFAQTASPKATPAKGSKSGRATR